MYVGNVDCRNERYKPSNELCRKTNDILGNWTFKCYCADSLYKIKGKNGISNSLRSRYRISGGKYVEFICVLNNRAEIPFALAYGMDSPKYKAS